MADKPQPKPTTHKLDALKASDLPQKHHQVGRRVFDRAESRGLAAFDNEVDKPAPKKAHDDDADLRHARMDASEHDDDDGMVVTSGSNWDDVMRGGAPPSKKGRAAAKAPVEEVAEEEEAEAPPRRSPWKWIVGGLVVAGVGVGGV